MGTCRSQGLDSGSAKVLLAKEIFDGKSISKCRSNFIHFYFIYLFHPKITTINIKYTSRRRDMKKGRQKYTLLTRCPCLNDSNKVCIRA